MRATTAIGLFLIASTWIPASPLLAQQATPTDADVVDTLPPTIPLFPLQDVMLFPNISRPFHIFEPRYRAMVSDALNGDRVIGMVLVEPGHDDNFDGTPPIYAVGCAGVIDDVQMFPDGRYNIVLKGLTKFRVLRENLDLAYRVAEVEALPEVIDEDERAELRAQRPALSAAFARRVPEAEPPPPELTDEDFVNGLAQFLVLDPSDRQHLLEQDGPLARSLALLEVMSRDDAR